MAELKTKFADAFGAAGLSGKETAVIYEQSMNSGFGQSCRGYFLLTMLGYPKIKVLHGGYDAWAAKGLPVTTEVPSPAPASFAIVPEAGDILIDAKTMLAAVGKPDIALLDVRDVDEWIGESSSPYGKDFCPRKGRIPGAVWLEWYRMMKPTAEGPRFKSKDEILAECATVGITQDTPVYLYCFKGARASNTFLALKNAGVKDVRMYFGSWNEWSRDPSLPIEEGLPTARQAARQGGIARACISSPGQPRPGVNNWPDRGGAGLLPRWLTEERSMSTFDDAFDADRELSRSGCVCGQHRSAAEHEQAALALRCEPVAERGEALRGRRRLRRGAGDVSGGRRAPRLPEIGRRFDRARCDLAILPASRPRPRPSRKPAPPEKKDLKVGFIPITCATPIIMAAPLGFYSKHGLNVEVVKTAGWAVDSRQDHQQGIRRRPHAGADADRDLAGPRLATRFRSRCRRSRTSTGRASRLR